MKIKIKNAEIQTKSLLAITTLISAGCLLYFSILKMDNSIRVSWDTIIGLIILTCVNYYFYVRERKK